jgi:hypothetical protein
MSHQNRKGITENDFEVKNTSDNSDNLDTSKDNISQAVNTPSKPVMISMTDVINNLKNNKSPNTPPKPVMISMTDIFKSKTENK